MTGFAPSVFSACGCWQLGAAGALARVTPEIAKSGQELSNVSQEANAKGTLAVQYTKDIADVLQGFQGGASLDLNTFQQIKELIDNKKARTALALAREMDDMALDMTTKANHMSQVLTDAALEIIPENVREDMNMTTTEGTKTRGGMGDDNADNNHDNDNNEDEEASALMELLGHADSDVEEVQTNTRSMQDVDIFTAGNKGRDAFSRVADKEHVAVQIFREIQSVSDSMVETLVVASGGGDSSLCAQFMSAMAGVDALFKALRLSKLIQRALDTVRRILGAFMAFISTSWDKFQHFFDQFDAGKKLERFTDGLKHKFGKLGEVFG